MLSFFQLATVTSMQDSVGSIRNCTCCRVKRVAGYASSADITRRAEIVIIARKASIGIRASLCRTERLAKVGSLYYYGNHRYFLSLQPAIATCMLAAAALTESCLSFPAKRAAEFVCAASTTPREGFATIVSRVITATHTST